MHGYAYLSHAPEDHSDALGLAHFLTEAGASAWVDPEEPTEQRWELVRRSKVMSCSALVLLMSPRAAASTWVLREVELARAIGRPVLQLLLEGKRLPGPTVATEQWKNWGVGPGERFLSVLKGRLAAPASEKGRAVPVVGLIPPAGPGRQEREQLRPLMAAFASADPAAGSQLLVGADGTGKTDLAGALARALIADGELDVVVWVCARGRAAVVATYAEAARAVTGVDQADAGSAALGFVHWLTTPTRRWLVVLDAVEDLDELFGLWPAAGAGQLVVATRDHDRGRSARGRVVPVGPFSPDQARAYLAERLVGVPDRLSGADELAAELGYRPLSLGLAAAFVAEQDITCAGYAARLVATWHRAMQTADAGLLGPPQREPDAGEPAPDRVPDGEQVQAAILVAVDVAELQAPDGLVRPLLSLLGLLDPDAVPEEVITAPATLEYLTARRTLTGPGPVDALAVRAALAALARFQLIEVLDRPSGPGRLIRMHPAVRDAVDRESHIRVEVASAAAADALVQVWPDPEPDLTIARLWRANAASLQSRHSGPGLDRDDGVYIGREHGLHPLTLRVGRSLGEAGLFGFAIGHVDSHAARAEEILGPDHVDTLRLRGQLPVWMLATGDVAGAVDRWMQLLSQQERVLGRDDPDTTSTRELLARLATQPRVDQRGVAARVADERHRHGLPDTPVIRYHLRRAGREASDPIDLVAAYRELLRTHEDLGIRRRIADELGRANDPGGAADALQGLLIRQLRSTRAELAAWRGRAGDAAGAAAEYEALLSYELHVYGADSTGFDRPFWWESLGYWRARCGDAQAAAAAYAGQVDAIVRAQGPMYSGHPSMTARWNLAFWTGQSGDAAGAVVEFERLLAIQLRFFDAWDPELEVTRACIARWQARAAEPDPDPGRWAADIDDDFWESVDRLSWRYRERRD